MKKAKLSTTQMKVIDLMRNGWELARFTWFGQRTWLQEGGSGRGGSSKTVHGKTAAALLDMGLIKINERKDGRSFVTFALTELGKTIDVGEAHTPADKSA